MSHRYDFTQGGPVSEMAIVDTFTRLIFGEEGEYSTRELLIIQAFRLEDVNVSLDSYRDMGQYLRALGVGEMIRLVSAVHARLAGGASLVTGEADRSTPRRRTR